MFKPLFLALIFTGCLPTILVAQDAGTDKRVAELMKQAEKASQAGGLQHVHAETLYEEALKLAPDDAEVNMRMGICQLNGPQRHKALPYLLRSREVKPDQARINFLVGFAHQLNAEWDKAIEAFEQHRRSASFQDPEPMYNQADKHIQECRNGRTLMAAPVGAAVRNVGSGINTPSSDYGALVTADGDLLLLTSRRPSPTNPKVNKATGEYFEDIYFTRRKAGEWSTLQLMGAPVNTAGNDASVGLFNDGRTMIIYRDMGGSGDLFESSRTGDQWSEPRPIGATINTPGHESSAWYSFDRQWLYFVSDRAEDNVGGQDIYRSPWNATAGQWGVPENLGPMVNTIHDEDGIFVHPDGRSIYFSSRGHTSMGGYDIFRSRLENGQWTKPENLGWPINSADDDLFFVLTADGSTGYFSSLRPDGAGEDDIYVVDFLAGTSGATDDRTVGAAKAVVPAPEGAGTVLLKGRVKDLALLGQMEATIELMDLQDATVVARFTSDPTTGEYMIVVPAGRDYAMHVKADGYLLHSEYIHVPAGQRGLDLAVDIGMEPLSNGSRMELRNVFFPTGSAELQPTSMAELDQVLQMLQQNVDLRLEVSGHTDNAGPPEVNQRLSEARANSVRDHLVGKGIDASRLTAIGHGDALPVVPNDSDAERARNRRTEIKVL